MQHAIFNKVPAIADESRSQARVLIVDDVDDNRDILRRRLEKWNYVVFEAQNGKQALEFLERNDCDIVLLDVMMPEMDGIETLQHIRYSRSEGSLPVIMVTAKSQSDDIVTALKLGANDYVTKPVNFPVTMARINTQLSRKRAEEQVSAVLQHLDVVNLDLEERIRTRTEHLQSINAKLMEEISRREASEAKSQYLAYHDALTGLANRLLFRELLSRHLDEAYRSESPLAVLIIDLDGFKNVNDTLGHSAGDELLRQIAALLRDNISEHDCVARLGGDEFAILQLGAAQPNAAVQLSNKIIEAISQPFQINNQEINVGASIGVVIADRDKSDAETLQKSADLAMYRAKSSGRGTYRLFDPEMEAELVARQSLEFDLRHALRSGQFELYFQPVVDSRNGRIMCFEALLRWNHPSRGRVMPSEFIPVAEEIGLIAGIGEWVLREVCKQATAWPQEVSVAVNLSPIQFFRGNLVATVVSALAAAGLASNRLELEVTESVLLEKNSRNLRTLQQLHDLGVKIAMDDFGTGYSGLSYLRNFSFDKIKIDQSFVRNMANVEADRAIVRAIIALGHAFGARITAEGVETSDQAGLLIAEGCSEVQGRLYSMPVPYRDTLKLLLDSK